MRLHLAFGLLSIFFTCTRVFAEERYSGFTGLSCQEVLSATPQRFEGDIKELRFLSYNTADIFEEVKKIHLELSKTPRRHLSREDQKNFEEKTLKLKEQIRIISESNSDVILLTEISSLEGLDAGLPSEIKIKYRPYFFKTNDIRQRSMTILVKNDLPWELKITSRHEQKWFDPVTRQQAPLFSRNFPQIEFFRTSLHGQAEEPPLFVFFGNHAKSQRSREGDARSETWRTAQYKEIHRIVKDFESRGVAVFLAGDFNVALDDEETTRELSGLSRTLVGSLSLYPDEDRRWTHSYHQLVREAQNASREFELPPQYNRLDEIMISPRLIRDVLLADVPLYQDANGHPITERPRTYQERNETQPSDHRPVFLIISTNILFRKS